MKRGDIVTAAPSGEFGKPRPVLVIQAFTEDFTERVTVALITSALLDVSGVRGRLEPTAENGLERTSEVAVDNVQTFSVRKIGPVIGSLAAETMKAVDEALRMHLGLL